MDITSGDKSALVRIWILEYACKFRMKKVAAVLLKDGPWKCAGCAKDSHHCINPVYLVYIMFEDLKMNAKTLLDKGITLGSLCQIDKRALHVCVNCLEVLYLRKEEIPFAVFYKLLYGLKLLILVVALVDGETKEAISRLVDIFFPHFNNAAQAKFASNFRLTEEESVAHQSKEREARVFILEMLLKHGRQDNNLVKDCLIPQAVVLLKKIVDSVPDIIRTGIKPDMTITFIEKILAAENKEEVYKENDLAVKLLLEFIHPDITEEELLRALCLLDPSMDIVSLTSEEETTSLTTPSRQASALSFLDMA